MEVLQRLRRCRVTVLVIVLACLAGVLWHAESRRTRSALPPSQPGPPPAASLTFEALVDSAASLEARFRLEMDSVPRDDDTRRLQSTIGYLKNVTYLYYDWAIGGGAVSLSAETITSEYLLPTVESVLEARPEIASGRGGLRSHAIVRLYFFDRRMLLTHGVIHASGHATRVASLRVVTTTA